MVSFSRVIPGMCMCNFWVAWILHLQELALITGPVQLGWKIIFSPLKSLNYCFRVRAELQMPWQRVNCRVYGCGFTWSYSSLPRLMTSFLPSAEQSVFVNWAAGVLIASSVWLHRSGSCSLYFLDMLPWRWKLTLMPNRKIWCFIKSTSRSMTMSGKKSSLSPSCQGRRDHPTT